MESLGGLHDSPLFDLGTYAWRKVSRPISQSDDTYKSSAQVGRRSAAFGPYVETECMHILHTEYAGYEDTRAAAGYFLGSLCVYSILNLQLNATVLCLAKILYALKSATLIQFLNCKWFFNSTAVFYMGKREKRSSGCGMLFFHVVRL